MLNSYRMDINLLSCIFGGFPHLNPPQEQKESSCDAYLLLFQKYISNSNINFSDEHKFFPNYGSVLVYLKVLNEETYMLYLLSLDQ